MNCFSEHGIYVEERCDSWQVLLLWWPRNNTDHRYNVHVSRPSSSSVYIVCTRRNHLVINRAVLYQKEPSGYQSCGSLPEWTIWLSIVRFCTRFSSSSIVWFCVKENLNKRPSSFIKTPKQIVSGRRVLFPVRMISSVLSWKVKDKLQKFWRR